MANLKPIGDGTSIAEQTYNEILHYISEEDMIGNKLPPETELAKMLGISRTALRDALQRLEVEGYISRRRKIGTIVLARRLDLDAGLERLNSVTQIIESAGMKAGTAFRKWRTEPANSLIAKMLNIEVGTEVTVIGRVRTANDLRLCYDINFIPVEYITEAEDKHITESLLNYLSAKHGVINRAITYFHPYTADHMVSQILEVPVGHLLMLLEHTHYSPVGKPMWYSRTFHRSDIISFHIVRSL